MKKRRNLLLSLSGGLALFFLFFGAGVLWFGGTGQFLAFVNGKPLYLSPRHIDLGAHEAGTETTAIFKMTNLASREISIVGARTGCDCTLPEDMPIAIPPGKTVDLEIGVRLPRFESSYDQTVIFMVAEPNRLGMHPVRITATIPNPLPRPVAEPSPEVSDTEPTEDQPPQE